ncbi:hypothetical protein Q4493_14360 [Colwellia sp. 1_MG-2023]|uniref:hypothetical protein n=1 Tax=Colwellia sp. 1_MG-2023 TaxID=3062649 RepID=UPI0026E40B92|nr:hypothetical protein [Colwellia sp. 1_MG-2023]MDO6446953.1 hypothetical protein [Colwellia sp. 1_MG-2023]
MRTKIEVINNSEIIKVVFTGNVTFDDRINVIHELCTDYYPLFTKLRILIDTRQVIKKLTESEQIILGTFVASRIELKEALVAVIVEKNIMLNEQAIKKSSQLGHNIKVFYTEKEALTWLNVKC